MPNDSPEQVAVYKVKGEGVSDPFVTFGHAEMVMLTDHSKALISELRTLLDNAHLILLNEPTKILIRKRIGEIQRGEHIK